MSPLEEEKHRQFLGHFTAHESAIHAYVRRLVPRREDALDVMQDIAIVLWKKFDQLDKDRDFRPWAFGVARYQVLAWRRDIARERERLIISQDTIELIAKEIESKTDQLDLEREAILQHCLKQLKTDQRSAIQTMYGENHFDCSELAKQFGKTLTGFYQWIYRIRQKLSECAQRFANDTA